MPTNFEFKRLKLRLDIVEKPENRVHKLTDSNGAPRPRTTGVSVAVKPSAARADICKQLLAAHVRVRARA